MIFHHKKILYPGMHSLLPRVSFQGLRRGSITAEAALSFPVFFLIVICLVSIMNVYGRTIERMSSLRDMVETAAVAAGETDDADWIDITLPEAFRPYFMPDGLPGAVIPVRGRVRVWNGRSASEGEGSSGDGTEYVYVTENESVYHTDSSCTHLELSTHGVSWAQVPGLRNSDGSRYKPCEKCCKNGHSSVVYITDDGDRYHSSADCPGLKRTVRLVPADSVPELCECKRCAAKRAA